MWLLCRLKRFANKASAAHCCVVRTLNCIAICFFSKRCCLALAQALFVVFGQLGGALAAFLFFGGAF